MSDTSNVPKPKRHDVSDAEIDAIGRLEEAPLIYIDGMQGMLLSNGNVKIALYQLVQDTQRSGVETPLQKLVVARLIIPQVALPGIAEWLARGAQGIAATAEPPADAKS